MLSFFWLSPIFPQIPLQKLVNRPFRRRTPIQVMLELPGALANSQLPSLSTVSLTNADFILKLSQQAFFF